MADERRPGMDEEFSLELDDELNLDLDEFEDFSSVEDEFWAPYNESLRRAQEQGGENLPPAAAPEPVRQERGEEATMRFNPAAPAFAQEDIGPGPQDWAAEGWGAGWDGGQNASQPQYGDPQGQETPPPPPAPVAKKKKKRRIPGGLLALFYVVFVIGGSILLATAGWMWANDVLALNKSYRAVVVEITSETTVDDAAQMLKDQNIIEYPFLFKLYCAFTKSGDKLSFGSYEVNTNMDYHALVSALSSSSSTMQTTSVTIPEGYTLDQIFQLLVDNGVCENTEVLKDMAANHNYKFEWLQEIPLGDYHRLEGYLFPDTYEFYLGQDPLYVINKMLCNYDDQVTDEMYEQASNLGYTMHQVLIVASMIEKETNGYDQKDIASVIYNRLAGTETNGYLQFDSTVQYVLEYLGMERKDKLTTDDLAIDNPYNTYVYTGLPAGPICNPGQEAIQAALNPNSTDYYYFLQDNYGNSYFYNDYDEFVIGKDTYLADDYVAEEDNTNYEGFEDNG